MTYRHVYRVKDNTLVIELPSGFKGKEVVVTVDDTPTVQMEKMKLMELASKDPLYLQDMNEVNDDFKYIDHETL